jgi:Mg2+-importing ATPase
LENKDFIFYANASTEKVFDDLHTSAQGLTQEEAKQRLATYGPNRLQQTVTTAWTIFINQIKNPFIFMFVFIALLYFFTQQYTESIILIIIMIVNTVIGFYQEYHSNKAMELLQSYLQDTTTVHRNGSDATIAIGDVVPGDVIVLKAGDIIPADCCIIESNNLVVDEASLSGESVPVNKTHEQQSAEKITALWQAKTCCFAGTVVVDGTGLGVVFATGIRSQLGSIASLATHTIVKSNLAKGTMQLARVVLMLVLTSLVLVVFINVFIKTEQVSLLNMLFFGAALAITAIPSALPIVITFCLTKGAMALHKHKMIVKRLSAIEDLGSIDVFCTDKTGTLTENVLTVADIYDANSYDILVYAALASDMTTMSNSFDAAIAQKLTSEQKTVCAQYTIIKSLPFTYERRRSITLVKKDDTYFLITKGSYEYVVTQCPSLQKSEIDALQEWMHNHESQTNRVLAIAIKKLSHDEPEKIEDTTYDCVGLIAFVDPLKMTALTAVKKAQALAVQIKVLSGDSRDVCFTIAQQLGLENDINNVVLGTDFENATEEQKMFFAYNRTIFARITPEQKYQLIAYLQRKYSVGYIGDGINDAPALKIAQVGIAVSDAAPVAREAAEIILLQKSLLNIILGIEEGRKIITNTLKYIKITIASNVGNFYSLAFSSLLINYLPMLPLQLLFLDLITDFPLIAISTDAVTHQELKKPLQYSMKDISFVTFLFGLISSPFDFMIFAFFKSDAATLQTSWFIASALTQLALIFSLRTTLPFWRAHRPSLLLFSLCCVAVTIVLVLPCTQFGQKIFLFKQPTVHDLAIICAITIAYFIVTETVKIWYYHRRNNNK